LLRFNWAHRKLYNRLLQLGAQPICDRGESDEQHPEGIDGTFVPWSIELRKRLLEEYPLPQGIEPIPDEVVIEPKWVLRPLNSSCSGISSVAEPAGTDLPPLDLIPVPHGLPAMVESNIRLTPETHYQDTRHLIFTIPGKQEYGPGATLTIYPKNFPTDVSEFIHRMAWTGIADQPLEFVSTRSSNLDIPPIPDLPPHYVLTLRTLLTNHLDIMSIPRRSFFNHLLQCTDNEMYIERLKEFVSPDLIDELYDYTTRPRRSILEVLSDFSSIRLPWEKICSIIPMIRGRQFSIASGGELNSSKMADNTTRVDLLVAIVKYRTIMKRIRHGVATRYIANFEPGQEITVTLQKGGLNITQSDIFKPVVMIGPGTGLAPMRSLIYERKMLRQQLGLADQDDRIRDLLFFGCRKKDADEYFRGEWLNPDLNVKVFTAYSREQVADVCN
jgi:sulfite reductase alpha subunit-like flavoprotein